MSGTPTNTSAQFNPDPPCVLCEGVGFVPLPEHEAWAALFVACERCDTTGNEDVAQRLGNQAEAA